MALGDKLILAGLLTQEQWQEADRVAASEGGFVGAVLVQRGFVAADVLSRFLEEGFGIPTVARDVLTVDQATCELAPPDFWRELRAVPLAKQGDVLTVAVARPLDVFVLDRLKKQLGAAVRPVFATTDVLTDALSSIATEPELQERPIETAEPSPEISGTEALFSQREPLAPEPVPEVPEPDGPAGPVGLPPENEAEVSGQPVAVDDGAVAATPSGPSQEPTLEEPPPGEEAPLETDRSVDAEVLDELLHCLDEGLGWVVVVGDQSGRKQHIRALRHALEERGKPVVYFSSAERPYGQLESTESASDTVIVLEDLDALEGHVPEQALLLREVQAAHAQRSSLVAGASVAPVKLQSLEPSLRVAISLARVFPLGRPVPQWLESVVRESVVLFEEVGLPAVAGDVISRLGARDTSGSASLAIDGCKRLLGAS